MDAAAAIPGEGASAAAVSAANASALPSDVATAAGAVSSSVNVSNATRTLLGDIPRHSGALAAIRPFRIATAARKRSAPEAPRPARARIDGRSPGSRVVALHRLPGLPQWPLWFGLAAYSCGGSRGIGRRVARRSAPHSLSARCRETVDPRQLTVGAVALSMWSLRVAGRRCRGFVGHEAVMHPEHGSETPIHGGEAHSRARRRPVRAKAAMPKA